MEVKEIETLEEALEVYDRMAAALKKMGRVTDEQIELVRQSLIKEYNKE